MFQIVVSELSTTGKTLYFGENVLLNVFLPVVVTLIVSMSFTEEKHQKKALMENNSSSFRLGQLFPISKRNV